MDFFEKRNPPKRTLKRVATFDSYRTVVRPFFSLRWYRFQHCIKTIVYDPYNGKPSRLSCSPYLMCRVPLGTGQYEFYKSDYVSTVLLKRLFIKMHLFLSRLGFVTLQ